MEAAIALTGQVAGRIESVEPVESIIRSTVESFRQCLQELNQYA
jgi:NAD(P)H-dependent flavin oxidoreductase YrpB (nitropropane dioxygenase family)